MLTTIKALSMWQPWASLVGTGAKRYETRSWSTNYRGLLLICSAKKKDLSSLRLLREESFQLGLGRGCKFLQVMIGGEYYPDEPSIYCGDCDRGAEKHSPTITARDLPYGEAIAIVDLVDVIPTGTMSRAEFGRYEVHYGDFHPGRFAWQLENVKPFPPGVKIGGARGLFEVDTELLVIQLGSMPMALDLLHEAVSRL